MKGLETSLSTIGKQNRRQDDERDTGEKYWVSATTMALEIHDKVASGHRPHCGLKWPPESAGNESNELSRGN